MADRDFQLQVPGNVREVLRTAQQHLLDRLGNDHIWNDGEAEWYDYADFHTALTLLDGGYVYSAVIHLQSILVRHDNEQAVLNIASKAAQ